MIGQEKMQEILGEERMAPFLCVSQAKPTTCEKCGCKLPEPGRVTIFDGMKSKTWCDCITEEEMQDVVADFQVIHALYHMKPQKGEAT
jgi:hypothetical protein